MSEFRLPDVGEGLHEAEIVAWHVGLGDHVVADQPLVSVETDKAVVELPSPRSGQIAAIHGAPGDVVKVGAVLVDYLDGEHTDAGAVVGDLPSAAAPALTAPSHSPLPARLGGRAAPAVRALAGRLGVDLGNVVGSGPDGAVTSVDVEAAAADHVDPTTAGVIEPLRGVRRAMDANMSRAHTEVVPATVTDEADIGDWPDGIDLTVRLVRAIAAACAAEPALNSSYLGRDRGRRLNPKVDIGIAIDAPDGLFVPVLRNAGGRHPDDLRRALEGMKADVGARTIAPEHLRGQTITLSNFGVFGGRHAALVVVPPQVAIIGAGRARDAVIAIRGTVTVSRLLPISLTFDHRVVMGGEATRFLSALISDLEAET